MKVEATNLGELFELFSMLLLVGSFIEVSTLDRSRWRIFFKLKLAWLCMLPGLPTFREWYWPGWLRVALAVGSAPEACVSCPSAEPDLELGNPRFDSLLAWT